MNQMRLSIKLKKELDKLDVMVGKAICEGCPLCDPAIVNQSNKVDRLINQVNMGNSYKDYPIR